MIDNFFKYHDYVRVSEIIKKITSWEFSGQSKNDEEPTFWFAELHENIELLDHFKSALEFNYQLRDIDVKAFYANGQSHGQCGGFHVDSVDDRCRTLLYYANTDWKVEWGGFTVFRDANEDIATVICPKPNRAILFKSNLIHAGFEPTKLFPGLRITVALKFFVF